jgi:hypothetical protein
MWKKLIEIGQHPFSGERDVNIKVTCRTVDQASLWFGPSSIFARDEKEYLEILEIIGLVPGKEYNIKSVDGFGDLFDVIVEVNEKKLSLLSAFFIDTYCNATKVTYKNSEGKNKIAYIEDTRYYASWIERIKLEDSNAIFEEVYLESSA